MAAQGAELHQPLMRPAHLVRPLKSRTTLPMAGIGAGRLLQFPPRPQKASEKNSVWKCVVFFLPPPISHHLRAQASGKIASRKIVC
jgi:hypothetical protein